MLERRAEAFAELAAAVDRGRSEPDALDPPEVTAEGRRRCRFRRSALARARSGRSPLLELLGPLMSMIVLPYLGAQAAERELHRPSPRPRRAQARPRQRARRVDPLDGLKMRLTYRTVRVLMVIAASPGASNREIAEYSGIADQGQISKLLNRLARLELVVNTGEGQEKGAANAWHLTTRGEAVERATRPR